MKTNVAKTSIDCYHSNHGTYDGIKLRIIDALEHGKNYTRREISRIVDIDYSCASGRVNELVKAGALVEVGEAPRGHKGRNVGVVSLVIA